MAGLTVLTSPPAQDPLRGRGVGNHHGSSVLGGQAGPLRSGGDALATTDTAAGRPFGQLALLP